MKYDVTYRSEIYDAGRNWEGSPITGYEHSVMLELENGQRFLLTTSAYPDTIIVNGEVQDNTVKALEVTNNRVNKVELHLKQGKKLNPLYWEETDPIYGTAFSDMLPMCDINLFQP